MIGSPAAPHDMTVSEAIRLLARGLRRPWRAREIVLLLEMSGFGAVDQQAVRVEVYRFPETYRRVTPGVYEVVL